MCGIAGVFGRSEPRTVERMLARLRHRGPDDVHLVAGPGFSIGARRLAILDPEHGRQPASNESGTVHAVLNGELYDPEEIAAGLRAAGHHLRSRSDTELLPHLHEDRGRGAIAGLDGMFAIALWDEGTRSGLLARDRLGKKPLYLLERAGALYFASEIKALLVVPGFTRRLDLEALHHYLTYRHVPHPLSIFRGIRALPPAHLATRGVEGPTRLERYGAVDFHSGDGPADVEEASRALLGRLRRAVRRRLRADVPIGFFSSGGLDSSLVAAIAAETSTRPLRTYTLGYSPGATTAAKEEDRSWARWLSERYGTEHAEETIDAEDFRDAFRSVLRSFDEPFAGVTSTWFLSRRIARDVKVALSGDGADELFGSYLSHRLARRLSGHGLREGPLHEPGDEAWARRLAGRSEAEWRLALLGFGEEEKRALYAADLRPETERFSTLEHLRARFAEVATVDPLNRVLEAELGSFLPDQVLAFADRLSMAHALEIRSPYLDASLVDLVCRLPADLKIRDGETKFLLRKAALCYLPPSMVNRSKEGFVMPTTDWLGSRLEPWVRDVLHPDRVRRHGVLDADAVGRVVDRFYDGDRRDHRRGNELLTLMALEEWLDLYLDGAAAE